VVPHRSCRQCSDAGRPAGGSGLLGSRPPTVAHSSHRLWLSRIQPGLSAVVPTRASGDVATSPIRLVGPSAPLSSAASASPGAPVLLRAPQSFSGASLHGLRAPVRARGEPERRAEVVRQVRVVGVAQLVRERRQVEARIHPELLGRLL